MTQMGAGLAVEFRRVGEEADGGVVVQDGEAVEDGVSGHVGPRMFSNQQRLSGRVRMLARWPFGAELSGKARALGSAGFACEVIGMDKGAAPGGAG